ncbi:MAG: hypothetical protein KBC56_08685 [Flavobacterium sp.]|nr:hypothetical protein [Flavobacterium sp.]
MISTNRVRNTTLAIMNKANRGFLKPDDYNLFSKMAQLSILEDLSFRYNDSLNKQNKRLTGTEYADIPKHIREVIDIFSNYSTPSNFTYDATSNLWSYNGGDLYRTTGLSLVNGNKRIDYEEVNKSELNVIANIPLVAPTTTFPIYVKTGLDYRVYPVLTGSLFAELTYLRSPKEPKWTYVLSNGNPLYNPSDPLLQDFEIPESLYNRLVIKILEYSGVSIRESDIVQLAGQEDAAITAKQQ